MREGTGAALAQECAVCGRRLYLKAVARSRFFGAWRHAPGEEHRTRSAWIGKNLEKARMAAGIEREEFAAAVGVCVSKVWQTEVHPEWGTGINKAEAVAWISSVLPIVPDYRPGREGRSVGAHRCRYKPAKPRKGSTPPRAIVAPHGHELHGDDWSRGWKPGDDERDDARDFG